MGMPWRWCTLSMAAHAGDAGDADGARVVGARDGLPRWGNMATMARWVGDIALRCMGQMTGGRTTHAHCHTTSCLHAASVAAARG